MRILSQAEQYSWRTAAGRRLRLPHVKADTLDSMGITQRKLNGNYLSWLSDVSPEKMAEAGLWYPVGHEWGDHISQAHGVHPDKVYGVMSKTSPQRKWLDNLVDTHNIVSNYHHNPAGILTPGGISGSDNLKQALRVMAAPDDEDAIMAAFMGGKRPREVPKTLDFRHTLRDPEMGGEYNYMQQPGVVDSWMGRTMLWRKNRFQDAMSGGRPLTWPGKGTGKGLDKSTPVKKKNPHTGKWEAVGERPPNARDVALRVLGLGGGYDRMRNAMRNGAAVMGLPYTHIGQAAVWNDIGGTPNPEHEARPDLDLHSIDDPTELYKEMWARNASGLHVPVSSGLVMARIASHGEDPHGEEDTLDEGWPTDQDIQHLLRHILGSPHGYDHWEDEYL